MSARGRAGAAPSKSPLHPGVDAVRRHERHRLNRGDRARTFYGGREKSPSEAINPTPVPYPNDAAVVKHPG